MGTLKPPQSKGPLCRNTVVGTPAVDGRAVTFGTPNVTAHPSTAGVPTSY